MSKTYRGKSLALGGGGRFARLRDKLARRGAENPEALAAWIGRRKLGAKRFEDLSLRGRKAAKGAPDFRKIMRAKKGVAEE